jgi:hypothetical protein
MMSTTRKEILDLLAGGKISAAEAAELLSSAPTAGDTPDFAAEKPLKVEFAKEPSQEIAVEEMKASGKSKKLRWLHIRVGDLATGKSKVTVNLPLPLVRFGYSLGQHFSPELQGMDWDELDKAIREGGSNVLVDVRDEEDNEHVQIYVD